MSLTKCLYEAEVVANAAKKVIQGASSILRNDVNLYREYSYLGKRIDGSGEMWSVAKSKSLDARLRTSSKLSGTQTTLRKESKRFYSTKSFPIEELDKKPTVSTSDLQRTVLKPAHKPKNGPGSTVIGTRDAPEFEMTSSEVPSTRLARIFHYGSLAAGMGLGAAQQGFKHYAAGGSSSSLSMKSLLLSPANIERMAKKFSKMRGAALKIGQMMSFQDSTILPEEIQHILLRVQNSAHYMPPGQLERVMLKDLGKNWRERLFVSFDDVPVAAASIGQVHTAVIEADNGEFTPVVVKVQYPGVVNSIDSDLNNLLMLLTASSILPAGLFLDKTIANARTELKWECDYIRESQNLIRFRDMIEHDSAFSVPKVYNHLCGEHVLTMERMNGTEIVKGDWDQQTKNWIATQIMKLCLMEIKTYKFMQTDPNWANFLYNPKLGKIELLDFGAARDFGDEFIDDYINVLRSAVVKDRDGVEYYSKKLGYLTGLESQAMTQAHIDSVMVLGEAFSPLDNGGLPFNFKDQTITDRVKGNVGVMLNERLTPPPEETYSLHRKLSGVFLLCARLGATVPCEQLFREIIGYGDK